MKIQQISLDSKLEIQLHSRYTSKLKFFYFENKISYYGNKTSEIKETPTVYLWTKQIYQCDYKITFRSKKVDSVCTLLM